ncbi:hypothetical protein [Halostella sp. PRR32]|uniref:hypothetical protein n=1 Tax=Halostella sp. PRR32 TaxID=3098147 RepID=UPI00110E5FDB|nr:hypothetical protein [Halostella sp. PRR32]
MLLRIVLAVFGIVELLFPRKIVDYMMDVSTTAETTYELKPWVYSLARLEGLVFVLVAFWWGKNPDDDS